MAEFRTPAQQLLTELETAKLSVAVGLFGDDDAYVISTSLRDEKWGSHIPNCPVYYLVKDSEGGLLHITDSWWAAVYYCKNLEFTSHHVH